MTNSFKSMRGIIICSFSLEYQYIQLMPYIRIQIQLVSFLLYISTKLEDPRFQLEVARNESEYLIILSNGSKYLAYM